MPHNLILIHWPTYKCLYLTPALSFGLSHWKYILLSLSPVPPLGLKDSIFKILIVFDCAGSLLLCRLFSSCSKRRLLSSCSVLASHCGGFSYCRARALGYVAFISCSSKALEDRLNSCGARVPLIPGMWDLPGSGIEPMSSALAGRFFTTESPGNPQYFIFCFHFMYLYSDRQCIQMVQIHKYKRLYSGKPPDVKSRLIGKDLDGWERLKAKEGGRGWDG